MKTVTRIFASNRYITPIVEEGIDWDQLIGENPGSEDFAEAVWDACERVGLYNDSSDGVLCVYVRGEM